MNISPGGGLLSRALRVVRVLAGLHFRSNCLEVPDLRAIRVGWVRGFAFRSNCPAFPGSGPRT